MRTLDEESAHLFLAEAKRSSRLYRLYLATLLTGMRMGEVCGLRWADLNLTMGTAAIQQTVYWLYGSKKSRQPTALLLKAPKSRRSRREVSLFPEVIAELNAQRSDRAENRQLLGKEYHDYDLVFAQANGKPLHPSDVRKDFHAVLRRAKLPRIRFHDLRHSAAFTSRCTRTSCQV